MKLKALILMGLSTVSYAENKVIIQNSILNNSTGPEDVEIVLDPETSPIISSEDGNIYVVPQSAVLIGDNSVKPPVISMFISGNGTNQATIYGEVANNPISCQRQSTNWAPNFNGETFEFNETVTINNTEIDYTFEMFCINDLNQTDTASVTYYGTSSGNNGGGGDDDVAITGFNVEFLSTNRYRVSYTAVNATSCKGLSNRNDGWRDNTSNPEVIDITQSASWGLECQGQGGPVSINANFSSFQYDVTYQDDTPANCASVQTPPNYQRADYTFGQNVFVSSPSFPADTGKQHVLNVELGTYATVEFVFNSSDIDPEGDIKWSSLQPPLTNSVGLPKTSRWTVTECPGDLMVGSPTIGANCAADFGNGSGQIRLTSRSGTSRCQLVEGNTYYLNMIQTADPANTPDECLTTRGGGCGHLMRTVHN